MPRLVLDSGGVTWLAQRSPGAVAFISEFRSAGIWPPLVPSAVLIECLLGDGGRDAAANRLVKTCDLVEQLSLRTARRAAALRMAARRASAVDALVVTSAEPGGTVLTGDLDDLRALAANAVGVTVRPI